MPGTSFLSLPAELRLKIYYHLIPRGQELEFSILLGTRAPCLERQSSHCRTISKISLRVHPHITWYRYYQHDWKPTPKVSVQLLRVNKQMFEEVSSILYGENIFRFHVGRHDTSFLPFRPLDGFSSNNALRFLPDSAIRRLTQCEVIIQANMQATAKAWLARFAERFGNEHRLKRLLIAFFARPDVCFNHYLHNGRFEPNSQTHPYMVEGQKLRDSIKLNCKFQYWLEPLVALAPVEKVELYGHVSDTFKAQLVSILSTSTTKTLRRLEYPEQILFQRPRGKLRRTWRRVKSKTKTDPDYDWHGFTSGRYKCDYFREQIAVY